MSLTQSRTLIKDFLNYMNHKPDITVIILTLNEEIHLERCIRSLLPFVKRIVIVDSFSSDNTKEIAEKYKADFYQNEWKNNHANQFNWALENCNITTDWTMRMDADEYITEELANEITSQLSNEFAVFNCLEIPRNVIFKQKLIRFGGFYKIPLIRIWRSGIGKCEERWMDEHVILENPIIKKCQNVIIDENLNTIHWWTQKHNNYARREAADYLINKYNLDISTDSHKSNFSAGIKRHIKNNYYNTLPLFLRAFLYFMFRYFFNLGILDGKSGLVWHFLQGFWYRFLVDVNIYEIEKLANYQPENIKKYLQSYWSI